MLGRALLGLGGGGSLGALYGVFGRCTGGTCAVEWNALTPTAIGAGLGLLLVVCSRWD